MTDETLAKFDRIQNAVAAMAGNKLVCELVYRGNDLSRECLIRTYNPKQPAYHIERSMLATERQILDGIEAMLSTSRGVVMFGSVATN